MNFSGTTNLLLLLLGMTALLVVTSSKSLAPRMMLQEVKRTGGVPTCSRHMACGWALCPWVSKPGPEFPNERECLVVPNENCKCPPSYECQLTDLMDPGASHVKYEYKCMNPDVMREIYQIGRRRR